MRQQDTPIKGPSCTPMVGYSGYFRVADPLHDVGRETGKGYILRRLGHKAERAGVETGSPDL